MWAILSFFIVVFALYLGFGWLADNPGSVTFVWLGQQVELSFVLFVIAALVLIGIAVLLAWLALSVFRAPDKLGSWSTRRRQADGHAKLTTGIMAIGAGNAALARDMVRRSDGKIRAKDRPLHRFLDAQTSMIEGDHDRSRKIFEEMEGSNETKLLGIRGLYLEAQRVGDRSAEEYYAERALRIAPNLTWAGDAVLERKSATGDWDGALRILEAQRNTRLVDEKEARRLQAVLLTAKARDIAMTDPKGARKAGEKAQKFAPDFAPAALVAAKAAFRLNDTRRGARILETAWVHSAHPEVGEAYVHARPGDSSDDRLKRARKLHGLQSTDPESDVCLARAALDAGQLDLARTHAMKAAESRPREGIFLLLADIEEEQTGEIGRVREWLAKAIRAPRDPAWTADGIILEEWQPLSPRSGRLDAVEWKAPTERRLGNGDTVIDARSDETGDHARIVNPQNGHGAAGAANSAHAQSGAASDTGEPAVESLTAPTAPAAAPASSKVH